MNHMKAGIATADRLVTVSPGARVMGDGWLAGLMIDGTSHLLLPPCMWSHQSQSLKPCLP